MNKTLIVCAAAAMLAGATACSNSKQASETTDTAAEATENVNLSPAEANLKAGEEFLAENGKRPEVVTTESGLQYEVLTEGNGIKPTVDDAVTVHYTGKLIDGTVFDSSIERGEPITFGVTQVIPGWVEALQLMSVGSKWRLYIPSDLAYGSRGAGGVIGPNSTLIFDVELLEVPGK